MVAAVTVDEGANLHLRVGPSANTESVDLLPADTEMLVDGVNINGDWYRVDYEGVSGWVSARFVALSFNGRMLPRLDLEARLDRYDNLGNPIDDS